MGRHKTITDGEILEIAREVFVRHGHTAPTRDIAKKANVSEAVLYQRFGSKDALFFAAMAPGEPDLPAILGPKEPAGSAHDWITETVQRLAAHFEEILPRGLEVMMRARFDVASLARSGPTLGAGAIEKELAERLRALQERQALAATSPRATARLLVSLAHDHALHRVISSRGPSPFTRPIDDLVEIVWRGLAPRAGSAV